MNILVWQWGRRGAGPRFGVCLANALRNRPGIDVTLSLSRDAEILAATAPPQCEMPVRTYQGMASFLFRLATMPVALPPLLIRLVRQGVPDIAICAMPGPLDLLMAAAVKLLGGRLVVVVHDADSHPGDGIPGQMVLQRLLCQFADRLAVLCDHVAQRLRQQGVAADKLIAFEHPPFGFALSAAPRAGGPPRLLCFGRLLPYKGLDLLAEALKSIDGIEVLVAGQGPETPALDALRAVPCVTVRNRWLAEDDIGPLLAWSDAVILPYREGSQSGVAAAALAAGRPVIATRVGGLAEQLAGSPNAMLCDPDADSLAAAIRRWQAAPAPVENAVDATAAWREAVSGLLVGVGDLTRPEAGFARRESVSRHVRAAGLGIAGPRR